ncbi:hypothetical protein SY111_01000 [Ligilactobacillus agilis]|uniref:Uncharacterized protein n=1 Tax=Ligilactobacillus agilis TaxID=1601 RepID=A0A6F9Y193_9LACO|nr:hypothetical protein [Ligilactobacillus agilis]GET05206.1 hypothetical protein SY212_02360 [Ligilactobacillus agilis]GET07476.1 hypothetical protein SY111_01000 [Ligilactobacillus agilis]GET11208.1 hypothetical protein SN10121_16980 [Ligilactobacillus agilis]
MIDLEIKFTEIGMLIDKYGLNFKGVSAIDLAHDEDDLEGIVYVDAKQLLFTLPFKKLCRLNPQQLDRTIKQSLTTLLRGDGL